MILSYLITFVFAIHAFAVPMYKDRGGVLLIGDSMMRVGLGPVLKQELLAKYGAPVDLKAKSATGLARPDFYDWPTVSKSLLELKKYRQVIMMIGANDCQTIAENGKNHRFFTEKWKDIYRRRLLGLADQLCEQNRRVYWISLPPMRPIAFNSRIQKLNQFLQKSLAERPCVQWVPLESVFIESGKYSSTISKGGRQVRIREADGIHLTTQAGVIITKSLLELMNHQY